MDFTISLTKDYEITALTRAQQAYGGPAASMTQAEFVQLLFSSQVSGFVSMYMVKSLTNLQFMDRFSREEWVAIQNAAKASADVAYDLARFEKADGIDLTDARTIAGVNALEAAGLIASGRAAQILAL